MVEELILGARPILDAVKHLGHLRLAERGEIFGRKLLDLGAVVEHQPPRRLAQQRMDVRGIFGDEEVADLHAPGLGIGLCQRRLVMGRVDPDHAPSHSSIPR